MGKLKQIDKNNIHWERATGGREGNWGGGDLIIERKGKLGGLRKRCENYQEEKRRKTWVEATIFNSASRRGKFMVDYYTWEPRRNSK